MPSQNLRATRVKPSTTGALTLEVLRQERISPSFCRVTLGGVDLDRFRYLGFDQWFRLFIPVSPAAEGESNLQRLPDKLSTLKYVKFLMIDKDVRPVLRNYSVRAFRADAGAGPELDVDFVVHGDERGGAGLAANWATSCQPGDWVAILDEGASFNPPASAGDSVFLVSDESGLPALAGILASLPAEATGTAVIEVPDVSDRQPLVRPAGVDVQWLSREDDHETPGRAALVAVQSAPLPGESFYGFVVGEQSLATAVRRHWVDAGVPKNHITFCGYWRSASR